MLVKRISTFLMLSGVALWVLGFCAWISGVWITLSPAAAKVFVLGFAVLCGAVLLAAGAVVGRAYRRESVESRETEVGADVRERVASR
jgi:hypothetical protein